MSSCHDLSIQRFDFSTGTYIGLKKQLHLLLNVQTEIATMSTSPPQSSVSPTGAPFHVCSLTQPPGEVELEIDSDVHARDSDGCRTLSRLTYRRRWKFWYGLRHRVSAGDDNLYPDLCFRKVRERKSAAVTERVGQCTLYQCD